MQALCLLKDYFPSKKKTLKITTEKRPFGSTLCGTQFETSKKFKPSVLVLINVTGNAWGFREARGGGYHEGLLGRHSKLRQIGSNHDIQ